ncbi:hypothetical protein DYB36_012904 [Aphanomyces astaci]|nr:hypothetical protein DYB36_012904 [Aphanomyces astaci]
MPRNSGRRKVASQASLEVDARSTPMEPEPQPGDHEAILESMATIVMQVDLNGILTYMNRHTQLVLDCDASTGLGKAFVHTFVVSSSRKTIVDASHSAASSTRVDSRATVNKHLQGVLGTAEPAVFQCSLQTYGSPSTTMDVLFSASPRMDSSRNVIGCILVGTDVTSSAPDVKATSSSEHVYARILERANAPIFGVDHLGRVNIWNKKTAEITQFPASEVMGLHLVDTFIAPAYRGPVGEVLNQALHGVETANFEFPLDTKHGGRQLEILLNATSRYDEVGNIVGVVGIGQDITDRVAQEQEYSRLIDKANAPIFGVDSNCCVNIWNRKVAEITQYTMDEVVGENLVEKFISEEFRQGVRHVLSLALRGDETADFEVPLVTKTGRKVNISLNATARFDQMGHIIGVVGIGQDITDRIAQEQEYTRLIDTANAPIFGVDQNGLVNIWNKKAAEITQYTQQDVMGKNLVEKFITEDYRKAVG